jgi:quinol monooxygenase YgiN
MSDTQFYITDKTLILQGRLPAHSDKRDELAQHLVAAAELMQSIEACRMYIVSTSQVDVEGVYVTEMWDSAEDHQASLQREDVRALIQKARPLINGSPTGSRVTPIGGKGVASR